MNSRHVCYSIQIDCFKSLAGWAKGCASLPNKKGAVIAMTDEARETKPAVLRGLRLRCPACGEGKLFARYLKVADHCPKCGEELHHQRADDGPAYVTILLVGHVMGFALHGLSGYLLENPLLVAVLLSVLAAGMSLMMLPRIKGMLVAYQWATGMHGFGERPAI